MWVATRQAHNPTTPPRARQLQRHVRQPARRWLRCYEIDSLPRYELLLIARILKLEGEQIGARHAARVQPSRDIRPRLDGCATKRRVAKLVDLLRSKPPCQDEDPATCDSEDLLDLEGDASH
jgi:hypothetical protein